jgi:4-amino-4-deoxy-L-arabinose transferase-like glycosyltransferase
VTALRRADRALLACALAALLNLLAWSLLTPPFHVPDETAHFAYAQVLAETGSPPVAKRATVYSSEESAALERSYFFNVIGQPRSFPASTPSEQRQLDRALAIHRGRVGNGDANVATAQPPLYYAVQDVPYALGSGGSIFTRLALMRVVSCLFGVLTVVFCFAFVRELLPGTPWAAPVGALVVAFQPMFAFISSGVNPDAMLFAAAAALFWTVARAFRRGLTVGRGAAVGAALVVGALAKLNFLGLMPGVVVALAYLAWRDRRRPGRALVGAAVAVGVVALALGAYAVLNVAVWDRPALGLGSIGTLAQPGTGSGQAQSLSGLLSYTWQLYLPRLPGMLDWFPAYFPLRELWLNGLVGRFGWLDYGFAGWVYTWALWVVVAVLIAAAVGVARARAALRRRTIELVAYVLMAAGLLFIIARSGYQARSADQPLFEQARYLFPLLALYAAVVALAARAAGRRWGPALGALLVVGAAGHDIFAGLITLVRYYG